ncbi:acyl-CoA N-acyltransferase [Cytidiella melzeri]|nr:acyl-CoA N-acyltransferase [Cytidiella melzeri]
MADTNASPPSPELFIRPTIPSDSPAVSRICLLTADAGVSAESLHSAGELPGLMYAEPYVHLPECHGFVLVDPSLPGKKGEGEAVGYVLVSFDTRGFEQSRLVDWFPPYWEKYPLSAVDAEVTESTPAHLRSLTPQDKHYIRTIHKPHTAEDTQIAFSPAHLHIDILPEYQRQGWGKKLIGRAVKYLKEEKGLDRLWLGMDPRNTNAKSFYARLGFQEIPDTPVGTVGLRFEDWNDCM